MEKDVDEVGSIARFIKGKLEELDREVESLPLYLLILQLLIMPVSCILMFIHIL